MAEEAKKLKKAPKKQVAEKPEEKAPEATIKVSFEDFMKMYQVHPGLVASFKYEAMQTDEGMAPRTVDEWTNAIDAQADKTY